uniref:Uncharacterized protein n=1 Tax=Siphoviridae sp. ctJ3t72 TaxID=2826240 RepID=A0A8S5QN06_9CAUD|nr:MAG TPA: hypothetical protein [Siphoviridae sp. ctJ3t72]
MFFKNFYSNYLHFGFILLISIYILCILVLPLVSYQFLFLSS